MQPAFSSTTTTATSAGKTVEYPGNGSRRKYTPPANESGTYAGRNNRTMEPHSACRSWMIGKRQRGEVITARTSVRNSRSPSLFSLAISFSTLENLPENLQHLVSVRQQMVKTEQSDRPLRGECDD